MLTDYLLKNSPLILINNHILFRPEIVDGSLSRSHSEATEHSLRVSGEQVMRPRDGMTEGLVATRAALFRDVEVKQPVEVLQQRLR